MGNTIAIPTLCLAISVAVTLETVVGNVQAQPISAATPFEQLAQGQGQPQSQAQPQQPSATTAAAKPGTILLTTFPNGTSKAQFVNGTTIQVLNGVGYLVLDTSASGAASASVPVSNTVIYKIYQAIAIAIGITLPPLPNITEPTPVTPQPNSTQPSPEPIKCGQGEVLEGNNCVPAMCIPEDLDCDGKIDPPFLGPTIDCNGNPDEPLCNPDDQEPQPQPEPDPQPIEDEEEEESGGDGGSEEEASGDEESE